jgi:hypothetical protein
LTEKTILEQEEETRSAVGHTQDSVMQAAFTYIRAVASDSMAGARSGELSGRIAALVDASADLERKLLAIALEADREDQRRSSVLPSTQNVRLATSSGSPPESVPGQLHQRLRRLIDEAVPIANAANEIISELPREIPVFVLGARRRRRPFARGKFHVSHRGA